MYYLQVVYIVKIQMHQVYFLYFLNFQVRIYRTDVSDSLHEICILLVKNYVETKKICCVQTAQKTQAPSRRFECRRIMDSLSYFSFRRKIILNLNRYQFIKKLCIALHKTHKILLYIVFNSIATNRYKKRQSSKNFDQMHHYTKQNSCNITADLNYAIVAINCQLLIVKRSDNNNYLNNLNIYTIYNTIHVCKIYKYKICECSIYKIIVLKICELYNVVLVYNLCVNELYYFSLCLKFNFESFFNIKTLYIKINIATVSIFYKSILPNKRFLYKLLLTKFQQLSLFFLGGINGK